MSAIAAQLAMLSASAPVVFGLALGALGLALASVSPLPASRRGTAGLARARFVGSSTTRRALDWSLRQTGAWVRAARLALQNWRGLGPQLARLHAEHDISIREKAYAGGLSCDELLGAAAMGGAVGAALHVWVPGLAESPLGLALPCLLLALPLLVLMEAKGSHYRQVERDLPAALDLAALCAGAGLGLQSALERVVRETPAPGALTSELAQILQEVRLGRTREQALKALARRVPRQSVIQFVQAVTEAERRGVPLAATLSTQARVARQRRAVRAEELATRAGVLLVGPLMLLACCVMLLLVAPFVCEGLGL